MSASAQQMVSAMASSGRSRLGRTPLPLDQLTFYNPNRPDATEAIWQPFYDFQTFTQGASTTQQIFFQTPNGQGGKTLADTNMILGGQFPAPTAFLCTAIMIVFEPGNVVSATGTAGTALQNWNDTVKFNNNGYAILTIGSKPYLKDAPLGKFPPNFSNGGVAAIANASFQTANISTYVDYARAVGRYYEITPFLIPQSQNFDITLFWPGGLTLNANGRLGVIMDGFYYRQSQ